MEQKKLKLETYYLFFYFFQGVFWIIAGVFEAFAFTKIIYPSLFIAIAVVFTVLIFYVISRKREKVDEFSNEIMRSVKEVVLDMGLIIVAFTGVFSGLITSFDKYAIFNLKISIPWRSTLLILAGLGYCSIYIGYIVILKKRTSKYDVDKNDDNEENPNVQD